MDISGFKKAVALSVSFVFIVWSVIPPASIYAETPSPPANPQISVNELTINPDLASLEERFQSPEGPAGRVVIAIQDAHGFMDAQEHIRALIQEFQDQHGLELVALEGGAGRADHTLLRTFPDEAIKQSQVEKYMKQAELSGGEAAAILNPKAGIFYGVEDPKLYFENRNSFLKGLALKETNLHVLQLLERKMDKIRDEIFPPELLKFQRIEQKYQKNFIPLWEFMTTVFEEAEKQGILLQEKYPNVFLLFQAMAAVRKGAKPAKKEEVEDKVNEITAKIEGRVLFEEIKEMTLRIKSAYYKNEDIASLDRLYRNLGILKNLASLEITREDMGDYQQNEKEFSQDRFSGFLAKYKDTIDLKLDLGPALAFYRDAMRRDHALYDNLIRAMEKEGKRGAILVAGGFHTDGLKERMRKDHISYVILTPRIEHFEEENPYYQVMEGKVSYRRAGGFTIQVILATMGLDSKAAESFNEAFARGGLEEFAKQADLSEAERAWRENIIRVVKAQGALRDPGDLINLTQKLVREVAARVSPEARRERIEKMLAVLEEAFVTTMGRAADVRVAEFVGAMRSLLGYLGAKPLEPVHLDVLAATDWDFVKARPYLDLPEAGVVTYGQLYEATPRPPARVTPVEEVLAQRGIAPTEWQGRQEMITLSEAAAKGLLESYRELAARLPAVTARALGAAEEYAEVLRGYVEADITRMEVMRRYSDGSYTRDADYISASGKAWDAGKALREARRQWVRELIERGLTDGQIQRELEGAVRKEMAGRSEADRDRILKEEREGIQGTLGDRSLVEAELLALDRRIEGLRRIGVGSKRRIAAWIASELKALEGRRERSIKGHLGWVFRYLSVKMGGMREDLMEGLGIETPMTTPMGGIPMIPIDVAGSYREEEGTIRVGGEEIGRWGETISSVGEMLGRGINVDQAAVERVVEKFIRDYRKPVPAPAVAARALGAENKAAYEAGDVVKLGEEKEALFVLRVRDGKPLLIAGEILDHILERHQALTEIAGSRINASEDIITLVREVANRTQGYGMKHVEFDREIGTDNVVGVKELEALMGVSLEEAKTRGWVFQHGGQSLDKNAPNFNARAGRYEVDFSKLPAGISANIVAQPTRELNVILGSIPPSKDAFPGAAEVLAAWKMVSDAEINIEGGMGLITMFPGKAAPMFPEDKRIQAPEKAKDKAAAQEFWSSHVFVNRSPVTARGASLGAIMTFDQIDQRIDQIPPDLRPGLVFRFSDRPEPDGSFYFAVGNRSQEIPATNVSAFTAYEGSIYIKHLDSNNRFVPAYVRITTTGVEELREDELPKEVRREFGPLSARAIDATIDRIPREVRPGIAFLDTTEKVGFGVLNIQIDGGFGVGTKVLPVDHVVDFFTMDGKLYVESLTSASGFDPAQPAFYEIRPDYNNPYSEITRDEFDTLRARRVEVLGPELLRAKIQSIPRASTPFHLSSGLDKEGKPVLVLDTGDPANVLAVNHVVDFEVLANGNVRVRHLNSKAGFREEVAEISPSPLPAAKRIGTVPFPPQFQGFTPISGDREIKQAAVVLVNAHFQIGNLDNPMLAHHPLRDRLFARSFRDGGTMDVKIDNSTLHVPTPWGPPLKPTIKDEAGVFQGISPDGTQVLLNLGDQWISVDKSGNYNVARGASLGAAENRRAFDVGEVVVLSNGDVVFAARGKRPVLIVKETLDHIRSYHQAETEIAGSRIYATEDMSGLIRDVINQSEGYGLKHVEFDREIGTDSVVSVSDVESLMGMSLDAALEKGFVRKMPGQAVDNKAEGFNPRAGRYEVVFEKLSSELKGRIVAQPTKGMNVVLGSIPKSAEAFPGAGDVLARWKVVRDEIEGVSTTEGIGIITAFPGKAAPKFPEDSRIRDEKERTDARSFWDGHVFVNLSPVQARGASLGAEVVDVISKSFPLLESQRFLEVYRGKLRYFSEDKIGTINTRIDQIARNKDEVSRITALRGLEFELRRQLAVIEQRLEDLLGEKPGTLQIDYLGYPKAKKGEVPDFSGEPTQSVAKADIETDVPIVRGEKQYIYEVKSYPRMNWGSEVGHRNQLLKYQTAIKKGLIAGASVEVRGRVDKSFLDWAVGTAVGDIGKIPDVEILYTLELPSGAEYRFVLKRSRKGHGLKFKNDTTQYTPEDRQIIKGILRTLNDGSIKNILSATQIDPSQASPELVPLLSNPMGIKAYERFQEYESLRMNGCYDLLKAMAASERDDTLKIDALADFAATPEVLRAQVVKIFDDYQDFLAHNPEIAKVKKTYVVTDPQKKEQVIETIVRNVNAIREYELARAERESDKSDKKRGERARLGYDGPPQGISLDLDHIMIDAIQEVNSRTDKKTRGRAYGRDFIELKEIPSYLATQDRGYIEISVYDPLKREKKIFTPTRDKLSRFYREEIITRNISRAKDFIRNNPNNKPLQTAYGQHSNKIGALEKEIDALKLAKKEKVEAAPKEQKRAISDGFDKDILEKLTDLENRYASAMRGRQSAEWLGTALRVLSEEVSNQIKFIYAVDADGTIRVDEEKIRGSVTTGRAAHSELARGRNVYGAGELVFDKTDTGWILTEINNGSGHYRPPADLTLEYVRNLVREKYGMLVDNTKLTNSLVRGIGVVEDASLTEGPALTGAEAASLGAAEARKLMTDLSTHLDAIQPQDAELARFLRTLSKQINQGISFINDDNTGEEIAKDHLISVLSLLFLFRNINPQFKSNLDPIYSRFKQDVEKVSGGKVLEPVPGAVFDPREMMAVGVEGPKTGELDALVGEVRGLGLAVPFELRNREGAVIRTGIRKLMTPQVVVRKVPRGVKPVRDWLGDRAALGGILNRVREVMPHLNARITALTDQERLEAVKNTFKDPNATRFDKGDLLAAFGNILFMRAQGEKPEDRQLSPEEAEVYKLITDHLLTPANLDTLRAAVRQNQDITPEDRDQLTKDIDFVNDLEIPGLKPGEEIYFRASKIRDERILRVAGAVLNYVELGAIIPMARQTLQNAAASPHALTSSLSTLLQRIEIYLQGPEDFLHALVADLTPGDINAIVSELETVLPRIEASARALGVAEDYIQNELTPRERGYWPTVEGKLVAVTSNWPEYVRKAYNLFDRKARGQGTYEETWKELELALIAFRNEPSRPNFGKYGLGEMLGLFDEAAPGVKDDASRRLIAHEVLNIRQRVRNPLPHGQDRWTVGEVGTGKRRAVMLALPGEIVRDIREFAMPVGQISDSLELLERNRNYQEENRDGSQTDLQKERSVSETLRREISGLRRDFIGAQRRALGERMTRLGTNIVNVRVGEDRPVAFSKEQALKVIDMGLVLFDAKTYELIPTPSVFTLLGEAEFTSRLREVATARGASLGAAAPGPLAERELNFLAHQLGFGYPVEDKTGIREKLAETIKSGNVDAIGDQLYGHIMNSLPKLFENEKEALRVLLQAVRNLKPETVSAQVEKVAGDLLGQSAFANLSENDKAALEGKLAAQFEGVIQGVSLEVIAAKIEADERARRAAEASYQEHTDTPEERLDMDKGLENLSRDLAKFGEGLMRPKTKTNLVTKIGSLPITQDEIEEMFGKAFKAVPLDYLNRPLMDLIVYYTDAETARIQGVKKYLDQLKKDKRPELASRIQLKRTPVNQLAEAFRSHQKKVRKDENLIFVVPDVRSLADLREAHVMKHQDSDIPEGLSFVRGIISEAAVGLAEALKRSKGDPQRKRYLDFLETNLGISYLEDPKTQQVIITLNLAKFVEALLQRQEAARRVRVAA